MTARVEAICRYPVKGLSAERLEVATLEPNQGLAFDRVYAIENGPGRFKPYAPECLHRTAFLTLMRNPRLAELETAFEDATHMLTISRAGRPVVRGTLSTNAGRAIIAQFFAEFMRDELRGPPRIVSAAGHAFTDRGQDAVHIVNVETVRDLERTLGTRIATGRFRANIVLAGPKPWSEEAWVGRELQIGRSVLKVIAPTERCAATNVDPATGSRSLDIPAALRRHRGHANLGIYAIVIKGGEIDAESRVAIPD
ncbi:MAG: MOSC domain-containing protein [Hyphomicrobium sp.]|nr:MOSC domain-containing protein [Hyphomicrobium sp.]